MEIDDTTFDLMERFGGLEANKADDRRAVAGALGRLWHRTLAALLPTDLGDALLVSRGVLASLVRAYSRQPA